MNPKIICLLAAFSLALSGTVFAAGGKTYEMTGTVVAATGTTLAIQKGTEKYEFAIDPARARVRAGLAVTPSPQLYLGCSRRLDRCPRGFTGHVMAAPPFHSLPEGRRKGVPGKRKRRTPKVFANRR